MAVCLSRQHSECAEREDETSICFDAVEWTKAFTVKASQDWSQDKRRKVEKQNQMNHQKKRNKKEMFLTNMQELNIAIE